MYDLIKATAHQVSIKDATDVDELLALDNEEIFDLREEWIVFQRKNTKKRREQATTVNGNERKLPEPSERA